MNMFKKLIFAENEEDENQNEPTVNKTEKVSSFPASNTSFPKASTTFPVEAKTNSSDGDDVFGFTPSAPADEVFDEPKPTPVVEPTKVKSNLPNPHLDTMREKYEKSFNDMNKEGMDFFEFFRTVISSGDIHNPQIYPMAFNMSKSMSSSFTKESILVDADYYLQELTKLHGNIKNAGEGKAQSLQLEKQNEESSLKGDIGGLEEQIAQLKSELETKRSQLNSIGSKYQGTLNDITAKLQANDTARTELVNNIQIVVNNIKKINL